MAAFNKSIFVGNLCSDPTGKELGEKGTLVFDNLKWIMIPTGQKLLPIQYSFLARLRLLNLMKLK